MEFMDAIQNFTIANMNLQFMMRNKENLSNCYSYALDGHFNNSQTSYMPGHNIIFQKFSKSNNKSQVSFMFNNNIEKKFENFSKYIRNKEQSLIKDSMDHWNQMSTGYSEFFSSPKGYSYVSNSVASYLIGGFVGSKSQMNNEKHKLSYDLGEVIFKILNDYKYDKSLDKFKEEKKFDVNRIGRKSRFFPKDHNELFECEYNMAIWNSLVDKSKNTVKILNNDSHSKVTELKKDDVINLPKVSVKSIDIVNPISQMKPSDPGENSLSDQLKSGIEAIMCLNNSSNDCHCVTKPINMNSIKDNLDTRIPLKSEVENVSSEVEKHKSDVNLLNISSNSGNSHTFESRGRQYSECSVESTDSESFIVFEDKCCDFNYELTNLNYQESECEDSDCYCEEDDCGSEEDFENSCLTINVDEFENEVEDKEIQDANKRWNDSYKYVAITHDNSRRKVQFNDKTKVHRIVAWGYAYRAARYGPWEEMARDRNRFNDRIESVSHIISPILDASHRQLVYNKLYVNNGT